MSDLFLMRRFWCCSITWKSTRKKLNSSLIYSRLTFWFCSHKRNFPRGISTQIYPTWQFEVDGSCWRSMDASQFVQKNLNFTGKCENWKSMSFELQWSKIWLKITANNSISISGKTWSWLKKSKFRFKLEDWWLSALLTGEYNFPVWINWMV